MFSIATLKRERILSIKKNIRQIEDSRQWQKARVEILTWELTALTATLKAIAGPSCEPSSIQETDQSS